MGHEAFSLLAYLSDIERSALATMAEAISLAGYGTARLDVVSDGGPMTSGRSVRVDLSALRAQ
jgi:hypothetical protein